MWILIVIMMSGGMSSSNIDHIEFSSQDACNKAASTVKSSGETKSVYCVKK